MGVDLYLESRRNNEDRGPRYAALKFRLCKMLSLPCWFDKRWPGDDGGVTDDELIAAVQRLLTESIPPATERA